MNNLNSKEWWYCAGTRIIRTMSQCFLAEVGTSAVISQIEWKTVFGTVVLAGLLSFVTSLSGLPEVNNGQI